MASTSPASFQSIYFVFAVFQEGLPSGPKQLYSYGSGLIDPEDSLSHPMPDYPPCFTITKREDFYIHIIDENLFRWLRDFDACLFPGPCVGKAVLINGTHLVNRYEDICIELNKASGDKHSLDALELLIVRCLGQGMLFGNLIPRHLGQEYIVTEQHFPDLHSQSRPISEHSNLLDRIDEHHQGHQGLNVTTAPFQPHLGNAIPTGDAGPVLDNVTARDPHCVEGEGHSIANNGDDDDLSPASGALGYSTSHNVFGPGTMRSVLPTDICSLDPHYEHASDSLPVMADAIVDDEPADSSPGLTSHLTSTTTLTPSNSTANVSVSREDGWIFCRVPGCESKGFAPSRYQKGNYNKHQRKYHRKSHPG